MNTDYIFTFIAAVIYGFTAPGPIIFAVFAALFISLIIAGLIKIFASAKFSKIYMWTTIVVSGIAGLGHITSSSPY